MRKSLVVLSCSVLFALLAAPTVASAALGDLLVVSRASGSPGALGDNASFNTRRSTSADGRYVVFSTTAQNLGGGVTAATNVYRRDNLLGLTELVSRETGGAGLPGLDTSVDGVISADGNRIAFASNANNLSNEDNNAVTNIFVRDMTAATTTLVSRASGAGGAQSAVVSQTPTISGDGNVVGFRTGATNLDPDVVDGNGQIDAFVRDLTDSTTELISKSTAGVLTNQATDIGDISFDGSRVVMSTTATTLGGAVALGSSNIYVRNRTAGTTTLVSQPSGTADASGNGTSLRSTITDDGSQVAFMSNATNLSPDHPAATFQVYVRDLGSASTTLVSRAASGAPADSSAADPVISGDASILVFRSGATNLDGPGAADDQAYVRHMATGVTQLVSRIGRTGDAANEFIFDPTPGRTSKFVIFNTDATNLEPGTAIGKAQVYMRDVKVVDPVTPVVPPVTINGKSFTAKLSKKAFSVNATTGGGATGISGSATLKVSKKIVKSGKIVVKLKTRTVSSTLTTHKLRFTLSKKQNALVLKALKTKRSRVKLTVDLAATGPGTAGAAKISGKLRR